MIILKSIGKCRAFCVLQIWANELGLGMILLACRAPQRLCCRKMLHVARCAHSGVCMLQNNCTQVTKCRISLTLGTSNWCSRPSRVDTWTSRISSLWSFQERLWVFAPEKKAQRGSDTAGGHTAQPGGGGGRLQTTGLLTFLKALAILQAGGQRGSPGWRAESLLPPSTCPWEGPLFLFKWPQGGTQGAQLCSRGGGPSSSFHCPRCHGLQ